MNIHAQEALSGKPQGDAGRPRIINPILNQSPAIRRKDAERLVSQGRAEWVASDQLRLLASHPANLANAEAAARAYNEACMVPVRSAKELKHIPIVRPDIALTDRSFGSRRRFAGRNGPVRHLVSVEQ